MGDLYEHPMGSASRHVISSNGLARELGRRAVAELRELLTASDRASRQVLGALAAIGPLTVADLAEICAPMDQGDVRRGLSAAARVVTAIGDSYVLAHEALREEIAGQTDAATFLHAAVRWTERYVNEGWPDTTPAALVDGYVPLLLAGDRSLADLTSEARARFMRTRTGNNIAHSRELLTAFDAVAAADEPDMTTACVLARALTMLEVGYAELPEDIALGWGLVGEYHRCEYLASFQPYFLRINVFVEVAGAAARTGDTEHAHHFLGLAVIEAESHSESFGDQQILVVAKAAYRLGDFETARRLAERAIAAAEYANFRGSAELVHAVVTGQPLTTAGSSALDRVWAFNTLGRLDEAGAAVPHDGGVNESEGLLHVAEAAVRAGEPDRALRLVHDAMREKLFTATSYETAELTAWAATLAAAAGDQDYGRQLLRTVPDHAWRSGDVDVCSIAQATAAVTGDRGEVRVLLDTAYGDGAGARAAIAAARLGETGRAVRWLTAVEEDTRARAIADDRDKWARNQRFQCLPLITGAAARAGHVDVVVTLALSAIAQEQWYSASCAIAGLINGGAVTKATELAESLRSAGKYTDHHQHALAHIGSTAAQNGDIPLAERMAQTLNTASMWRDKITTEAAIAAAKTGTEAEARRLLAAVSDRGYRSRIEARITKLSGTTVSLDKARQGRFDIEVYASLMRTADNDLVVRALIDHVRTAQPLAQRVLDACAAADLAENAGHHEARTRLLEIAESTAFAVPDRDATIELVDVRTTVLMAAARHGDHEMFDRRLTKTVSPSSAGKVNVLLSAQLLAYAGRFTAADAAIMTATESHKLLALVGATRAALDGEHLDPHDTRPWIRTWLLAALRKTLTGELAELLVRYDPALAPLACTWFQLGSYDYP
jgi:hypothetical protein